MIKFNGALQGAIKNKYGTQEKFAKAANTNVTYVSQAVNGSRVLTADEQEHWAEVLGLKVFPSA